MRAHELIFEYRRDITATKFKDKLIARGESDSPADILASLEQADPTQNKQYMIWVVTRYLAGDFLLEDVTVVRQYLTKFIESRARIEQKDLGRYTLKTLKELINGLYKSTDSSDAKETGLYPVLPETKVLYNGPLGQFVIPLTLKASQALQRIGHEAEWCTADSRANTYFSQYSEKGPLYIWIDKSGEKYQFHFETDQFMDEYDSRLNSDALSYWFLDHPVTAKILKPKTIKYYTSMVKRNGAALKYVPDKLRTSELYLEAVKQDGWALRYVPDKFKTPELCLTAVKQNGWALNYVPVELKTPELCLAAVKQNGTALEYVPDKLRTSELYLEAVKQSGWALKYVSDKLKTLELCLAAVKQSGTALKYVPAQMRTLELCVAAVKQDNSALKYVPAELKTSELYLEAVKQDGWALEYVPDKLKTPELCLAAVKQSGTTLKYVPAKLKTLELCVAAVKQDNSAIYYVPNNARPAVRIKLGL